MLIVGTFVGGMMLSDFGSVYYASRRWTALAQFPAGVVALVAARVRKAAGPADEEQPMFKLGTLYTSVAGLLNVLVVMDAFYVARTRQTVPASRQARTPSR